MVTLNGEAEMPECGVQLNIACNTGRIRVSAMCAEKSDGMAQLNRAVLLFLVGLWAQTAGEDIRVRCIFGEDCVLPCLFQAASSELIHWYQGSKVVHSFYYGQDQLNMQDTYFQDRTSLFKDQVARGNASLLLRGTRIKDGGKYKCYSSTSLGSHESFVLLEVRAPIKSVDLSITGGEVHCLSRNIYPEPYLSWSIDPSESSGLLQPSNNSIQKSEDLFSVDSEVRILGNLSDHTYICSVTSADRTQTWEASLKYQENMMVTAAQPLTIPCFVPWNLTDFTLTWTFISEQESSTIFTFINLTGETKNNWPDQAQVDMIQAKSGNGSLQLQKLLSPERAGKYKCTFSSFQRTYTVLTHISIINENMVKEGEDTNILRIVLPVICVVVVIGGIIVWFKRKGSSRANTNKGGEESTARQTQSSEKELLATAQNNTVTS